MPLRLLLLSTCCASLTSCGTASHYLGMAGGLVNSITSPVLGLIRLSDSPDLPARTPSTADPAHDSRPTSAQRYHRPPTAPRPVP